MPSTSIKGFNNLRVYRITDPSVLPTLDELNESLAHRPARTPASQELSAAGFTPFIPGGDLAEWLPVPRATGDTAFAVSVLVAERMLPAKVVAAEVAARVAVIERDQMRNVYSKERAQLKDEVVQALLPRAFITTKRVNALIAPPYIYIDQTSAKLAELLLSLLREALGTLPVRPVGAAARPSKAMTKWVLDGLHSPTLKVGEAFKSASESSESSTLSGANVTLSDPELAELLREDWRIVQLELSRVRDERRTRFMLSDDLVFSGIRWPEELTDALRDEIGEDEHAATVQRASALLLLAEIDSLILTVLAHLGGEEAPAGAADDMEDIL